MKQPGVGWWGVTPYNGLCREAPPEGGTLFRMVVYKRIGNSMAEVTRVETLPYQTQHKTGGTFNFYLQRSSIQVTVLDSKKCNFLK